MKLLITILSAVIPGLLLAGSITLTTGNNKYVYAANTDVVVWHVDVVDESAGITVDWGDGTVSTGVHPPFNHVMTASSKALTVSGIDGLHKGWIGKVGTVYADQQPNTLNWRPSGPTADTVVLSGIKRLGNCAFYGTNPGSMTYMTVDLGTDLEVMENLSCYDLMAKDLLIPASCTYIGLYAIGSGPRNSKDATLKVHANNPVYADYGANAVVHKATGILIAAYGTVKYNANVKGIYEKQVGSSLYSGKVPFLAGGAIGYTANGYYVTTFKDVQNTTGIFLHMNGFFPDREPLYLTTGKSRRNTYRHDDFNLFDISFPLTKAELQSCTGYPWFLSGKTIQCSDGWLKPR